MQLTLQNALSKDSSVDIITQAAAIVRSAYLAIPSVRYDLILESGTILRNITAFGLQADRVRRAGEGATIKEHDGMGNFFPGKITNLREGSTIQ